MNTPGEQKPKHSSAIEMKLFVVVLSADKTQNTNEVAMLRSAQRRHFWSLVRPQHKLAAVELWWGKIKPEGEGSKTSKSLVCKCGSEFFFWLSVE